jgi:hypothetical protein
MVDKILYYKGLHKVKVVTESVGYYIVEAQEAFEDVVEGKRVKVEKGEQRIVTPDTLYKEMNCLPPNQEHAYELKMEKKLKELVDQQEQDNKDQK